MATAIEEVAPAVAGAPAPEKVDEVKEAAAVETPEKVEEAPKPAEGEGKKAEEGEEKKAEEGEAKKAEEGKKARKPRSRKPKSAGPHHPPYFEMIKAAILSQDGKAGASPYAIAKHMGEKHRDVLPARSRTRRASFPSGTAGDRVPRPPSGGAASARPCGKGGVQGAASCPGPPAGGFTAPAPGAQAVSFDQM
jgi:hypothetical protein